MTQPDGARAESHNFQVDLGGIVEILSRNLYSGPQVFVRELLQNGVDAITAHRAIDPGCPAEIRIVTDGTTITVTDTGIGLTPQQAEGLLATIGASSKRDEWGMSRSDFIGQFGIGLLSCFMVSPRITVHSRSAATPGQPVCWRGSNDGTWSAGVVTDDELPPELTGPGTTVTLDVMPGERHAEHEVLRRRILSYGSHLPVTVTLARRGAEPECLSAAVAPWEMDRDAAARWCDEEFGFAPFDQVPLDVPVAGLRGIAFVSARAGHPGQEQHHRVYLRRMLLSERAYDVVPEWAYFVRVVADAEHLKPTASREGLFDDELLEETRQGIGTAIRDWMNNLAEREPARFREFLALHLTGLKALAVTDAETRALVASSVPFSTSLGMLTLDEILGKHGRIAYATTDDRFRALRPVAEANGLCIVNAGFSYDEEVIGQIRLDRPEADIAELDPRDVLGVLEKVDLGTEAALIPLVDAAELALEGQKLNIVVRKFLPATMAVLFLPNPDAAGRALEERQRRDEGLFAGLVDLMHPEKADDHAPQLILNADAGIIHQLAGAAVGGGSPVVVESAIRGFYVQALLSGRHRMDAQVRAWSSNLFTALISASLDGGDTA
ncbi:HSP90 family protein [Corynebacterium meridianum]|uniref:HSP90 family protein n=1 Tax=Corynebacterium meridianum TaxID=2765363 RepID=A0A934M8T0_9CORY|nr:HSP90 family protein [Corynebacterium meridianum]MBI8989450.1 HSP90 family protein [Corynebacterium meridianum]MCK7677475.1 HSP90 family protein [Corynebacterium meridianum]